MKVGILERKFEKEKGKSKRSYNWIKIIAIIMLASLFYFTLTNDAKRKIDFKIEDIPQFKKTTKITPVSMAKEIIYKSYYITKLAGSGSESNIKNIIEDLNQKVEENKESISNDEFQYFKEILRLIRRYNEVKILRKSDASLSDYWFRTMKILGIEKFDEVTKEGSLELTGSVVDDPEQEEFWEKVERLVKISAFREISNLVGNQKLLKKKNNFCWFLFELEKTKIQNLEFLSSEDHLYFRLIQKKLMKKIQNKKIFSEKFPRKNLHYGASSNHHDYFLYLTLHPLDTMNRVTENAKNFLPNVLKFFYEDTANDKGDVCKGAKSQEEYNKCWRNQYKQTFPQNQNNQNNPNTPEPNPGMEVHRQSVNTKDYGYFNKNGIKYYYLDSSRNEVYFETSSNKRFYALKDPLDSSSYSIRGKQYHYLDRSRRMSYFMVNGKIYVVPVKLAKDYGSEYRNGIKHYYVDSWRKNVFFDYRGEIYFADAEMVKRNDYFTFNGVRCWYKDSRRDVCLYAIRDQIYVAHVETLKKAK